MNKLFYIYVLLCATIFLASCESAVKDTSIKASSTINSNVESAASEASTSEPVMSESSSLPVQEVPSTTVSSKVSSSATSATIAQSSAPASSKASSTKPLETKASSVVGVTPVAFDPKPYEDYANEYGVEIGLKQYNLAGDTWNAPINLYSALPDKKMKESIRSGLEAIKYYDNAEYFRIEIKHLKNYNYQLYIYYA